MFVLGTTNLPQPYKLTPTELEISSTKTTLNGRTVKDIKKQKQIYTLEYRNISVADFNAIKALYNAKASVYFNSNEADFIRSVEVVIDLKDVKFEKSPYNVYRFKLILTEVE